MEHLSKQDELKGDLLNFIEIIIHHYLYRRNVYPAEVFIERKMYGLQVFQIKKGVLFDYVNEIVEDLKKLLNITQTVRINLESDAEIREYLDIDLDKKLNIENMEFIQPKNERDTIFKKMLFNLDQKIISIFGYDFSQNYHVNSFNIQIITDGTQNQSSDAKYALVDKWILSKMIDDKQESNQNINHNQNNQMQVEQENNNDSSNNIQESKKQTKLIDSFQLSELNLGISHKVESTQ